MIFVVLKWISQILLLLWSSARHTPSSRSSATFLSTTILGHPPPPQTQLRRPWLPTTSGLHSCFAQHLLKWTGSPINRTKWVLKMKTLWTLSSGLSLLSLHGLVHTHTNCLNFEGLGKKNYNLSDFDSVGEWSVARVGLIKHIAPLAKLEAQTPEECGLVYASLLPSICYYISASTESTVLNCDSC